MLDRLNRLTNWQVAIAFAVVGFFILITGINNPFMFDDIKQIVTNVPVHSIKNIVSFFEGGTFYFGRGLAPLGGVYYRPLMSTAFSLLYTLFGPHPFAFHAFQFVLYLTSAFILYLFLKHFIKPVVALFLALLFLVHPLNSQVVFALPNMQDVLFFFFGILSLWLLVRFKSTKALLPTVLCLFLALLSKESGVVFVLIALVYLYLFYRKRLMSFSGMVVLPIVLWIVLKIHAVGLNGNPSNAPIDFLSFGERLLTMPSILLFYIEKFLLPLKLSSAYYWTYSTFSFAHVVIPLLIDLAVIGLFVYLGVQIHRNGTKKQFKSYLFFTIWTAIGLGIILQIIPLDMTACEAWFYFPMAGLLGMIGVSISVLPFNLRIDRRIFYIVAIAIIILLGIRMSLRGTDWSNPNTIAEKDVSTSNSDDYAAYDQLATVYFSEHEFSESVQSIKMSVAIFPNSQNYYILGYVLAYQGDYGSAYNAYIKGLTYQPYQPIYDQLAILSTHYGSPIQYEKLLQNRLLVTPSDYTLWFYLAVLQYRQIDISDAQNSITQALKYAPPNPTISAVYKSIMNETPLP